VNAAGSAGPTRNTLLQAFSLNNASRGFFTESCGRRVGATGG
jgi:hypothetical protein